MLADISIDADRVTWTSFTIGPYDLERSEPLKFEFDRQQYESAVTAANSLEPTSVVERF
ncbi:MAG TPA: hypothetical protein VFV63_05290 [Ilumatobacteraceae bacterium]|nr:hypothetical protein [Ilumatobacteraceae bacterium]